jgi:hypothetical protein
MRHRVRYQANSETEQSNGCFERALSQSPGLAVLFAANPGRMAQLLPAERELSPRVNRDAARVSHAADAEIVVVGSSRDDDLHLIGTLEIFLPIGPLN